ncbi:MAG: hypothetical protein KQI35_01420 [Bacteroidetes bacterium]|nr:hypothetical protein [Bacteroidota bacterium]
MKTDKPGISINRNEAGDLYILKHITIFYQSKYSSMKKYMIFLLLLIPSFYWVSAQDTLQKQKPKTPLKDKIYFGGSIGVSFGNYSRIAVYPMMGYKITPKLSAGIELGYEYISDNRYTSTYNTSNYGFSLFSRYRFIPQLYLHAEYSMVNYELYYIDQSRTREWVPFLFLGAGFSQQLASGIWAYAQIKFDVLQDENSPYNEWAPFYTFGISVGF